MMMMMMMMMMNKKIKIKKKTNLENQQTFAFCGGVDALFEHGGSTSVQHGDQLTQSLLDAVALAGHVGRTLPGEVGHAVGELVERQPLQVVVVEQQVRADLFHHLLDARHPDVLHLSLPTTSQ